MMRESEDDDIGNFSSEQLDNGDAFDDLNWWGFKPQNHSYKIITKESLLASQMDHLNRVMDVLSVRQQHARNLLIRYRWDISRLFEVFAEKGREFLFAQADICIVEHQKAVSLPSSSLNVIRCGICMEDVPIDDVSVMECGHCYCNTCWTLHFIVKIKDGQSRHVKCMMFQCKAICDEAIVTRLVRINDVELAEKFERCLLESYIEDNKKVKWCPSVPNCGNAICVDNEDVCEIECSCGLHFCFKCLEVEHSPCSCLIWQIWQQRIQKCCDESETVSWIAVHTKPCPCCTKPVQKNGGCNNMRCLCGQRFCWVCGKKISSGHNCGAYKGGSTLNMIGLANHDLDRDWHYYNHYKGHTDSFKLEAGLNRMMQFKVSVLKAKQRKPKDFRWVTDGIHRLYRSRRVLSNSYPLAYVIFGNHPFEDEMTKEERETKQHLFEYHQQQLEVHVEKLSMYLAEPFHDDRPEDKVNEIRIQVLDLTRIVDSLCKKMYEYVEDELLASLQVGQHSIAPYMSSFGLKLKFPTSLPSNNAKDMGITKQGRD